MEQCIQFPVGEKKKKKVVIRLIFEQDFSFLLYLSKDGRMKIISWKSIFHQGDLMVSDTWENHRLQLRVTQKIVYMEAARAKNKSRGIWIFICTMQFTIALRCIRQSQKIQVLHPTQTTQNLFCVYYFPIS